MGGSILLLPTFNQGSESYLEFYDRLLNHQLHHLARLQTGSSRGSGEYQPKNAQKRSNTEDAIEILPTSHQEEGSNHEEDTLPASHLNLLTVVWLERIHDELPQVAAEEFGDQLQEAKDPVDLVPEISGRLDDLLNRISAAEDESLIEVTEHKVKEEDLDYSLDLEDLEEEGDDEEFHSENEEGLKYDRKLRIRKVKEEKTIQTNQKKLEMGAEAYERHLALRRMHKLPIKCNYCDISIKGKRKLNEHCATVHGKEVHRCYKCYLNFGSTNELRRHHKVHRKERVLLNQKPKGKPETRDCGVGTDHVLSESEQKLTLDTELAVEVAPLIEIKDIFTESPVKEEQDFDYYPDQDNLDDLEEGEGKPIEEDIKLEIQSMTEKETKDETKLKKVKKKKKTSLTKKKEQIKLEMGAEAYERRLALRRKGKLLIKCPYCEVSVKGKRLLNEHCGTVHEKEVHRCYKCDLTFESRNEHRRHFKVHSKERECETCGQMFTKDSIRFHMFKVHNEAGFQCEQCPFLTYKSALLDTHMQLNHENSKAIVCEECGKGFCRRESLTRHMEVHAGIVYNCEHCAGRYRNRKAFLRHIKLLHGEKTINCEQCDYKAACQRHLRTHMITVHENVEFYPCDQCDYNALRPALLKEHRESKHMGIWFICDICDNRFSRKWHLKRHFMLKHKLDDIAAERRLPTTDGRSSLKLEPPNSNQSLPLI